MFKLNKIYCAVLLTGLLSTSVSAADISGATQDKFILQGTVTQPTCTVSLDNKDIDFGNFNAQEINEKSPGSLLKQNMVHFTLSNCPAGQSKILLNGWSGTTTTNPTYVNFSGNMNALAIRVANGQTKRAMNLNGQDGANHVINITNTTSQDFPLYFSLIKSPGANAKQVVNGNSFKATLNYNIVYP